MAILIMLLGLFQPAMAQDLQDFDDSLVLGDRDLRWRDHGFYFSTNLMYAMVNEDNDVPGATGEFDREKDLIMYDVKLGHLFRSGFYFGVGFAGETQNARTGAIDNQSRTSFGVGIGYKKRGWTLMAHYYFYSFQEIEQQNWLTPDPIEEYKKGSGFQLDVGYHFRINRYFYLGPMLSFRSLSYPEAQDNTNVIRDSSSNHTILTPMLSLMFNLYR